MKLTALHSQLKNTTTIHAASCSVVANKVKNAVREQLDETTVDEALLHLQTRDADIDRKVTVCQCAKDNAVAKALRAAGLNVEVR